MKAESNSSVNYFISKNMNMLRNLNKKNLPKLEIKKIIGYGFFRLKDVYILSGKKTMLLMEYYEKRKYVAYILGWLRMLNRINAKFEEN